MTPQLSQQMNNAEISNPSNMSQYLKDARSSIENRRSSQRFKVQLPVLIFGSESSLPVAARTRDISIDSFFCTLEEPFAIGQKLRCLILLSEHVMAGGGECGMCIEADAEVTRLVADGSESSFGIGCSTLNFRVVPAAAWVQSLPEVQVAAEAC